MNKCLKKHLVINLLLLALLFTACSKDETVPVVRSPYYNGAFEATIGGVYVAPQFWGSIYSGFNRYSNINGTDSSGMEFTSAYWGIHGRNSIEVRLFTHVANDDLVTTSGGQQITEGTFRALFGLRSYTFTPLAFRQAGMLVTWCDNDSVRWTSGKQTLNDTIPPQLPSHEEDAFTIRYSVPEQDPSEYRQRVQASFHCWIYNAEGDSMLIENAKFNGAFIY